MRAILVFMLLYTQHGSAGLCPQGSGVHCDIMELFVPDVFSNPVKQAELH